jgi:hypothetical protein
MQETSFGVFGDYLHDVVRVVPSKDTCHLVLSVCEGNNASLRDVDGDGVPEISSRTVSDRGYRDVIAAVGAEDGTVSHVHPAVAVAGDPLGLRQKIEQ